MAKLNLKSIVQLSSKKNIFKKRRRLNSFFFKFDRVVCLKSRWGYSSKNFKNNLLIRNRIHSYFDGVFTNSFFKKSIKSKKEFNDLIRYSRIRPEFRLDILLWRLNFFPSPYASRIAIRKNQILVNGLNQHFAYIVREGDIVKLNCDISLVTNLKSKLSTYVFNSFIEVDLLLKTFIVLYDFSRISSDMFTNIIRESFQFQNHINYLRRV